MKHMKTLFPALLALVLLTGCGRDYYTLETTLSVPTGEDIPQVSTALPETSPVGAISAPAVVTEGREPTEKFDLPAEVVDIDAWRDHSSRRDDMPVGKLIELPEKDVALYGVGVYPAGGSVAWLRWGDSLAEFDWKFGGPRMVMPALWCFDADSDGQEEVVAVTCGGIGTGLSISELHIVEKSEDGTLTDYCLSRDLFDELSSVMRTEAVSGRAFAVLGTELVDFTKRLPEDADLADMEGLVAGDIVYFEIMPDSDWGAYIRFRGSAWLDGIFPSMVGYVVDMTANVAYENGGFTLSEIHLNSKNN